MEFLLVLFFKTINYTTYYYNSVVVLLFPFPILSGKTNVTLDVYAFMLFDLFFSLLEWVNSYLLFSLISITLPPYLFIFFLQLRSSAKNEILSLVTAWTTRLLGVVGPQERYIVSYYRRRVVSFKIFFGDGVSFSSTEIQVALSILGTPLGCVSVLVSQYFCCELVWFHFCWRIVWLHLQVGFMVMICCRTLKFCFLLHIFGKRFAFS